MYEKMYEKKYGKEEYEKMKKEMKKGVHSGIDLKSSLRLLCIVSFDTPEPFGASVKPRERLFVYSFIQIGQDALNVHTHHLLQLRVLKLFLLSLIL